MGFFVVSWLVITENCNSPQPPFFSLPSSSDGFEFSFGMRAGVVLKRKPTAVLYGDAGTEEEGLDFLDKVFESGCRFWDTAEVGSIERR